MNKGTFQSRLSHNSIATATLVLVLAASPSAAETLQVPWECSTYEGDAQTRCVNAFLEAQQKKIAELEGKLQAQQNAVGQLKDQLDRQASATNDLQRQLAERPTMNVMPYSYSYPYPYPYPYGYAYPPGLGLGLGFGLQFGNAGFYASPYYYRSFWGHQHFRHWGHRW